MGDYTYRLSLWIEHSEADLSGVPTALGLHAQRLWKRGDTRIAPNGRVIGGVHRSSYCSIQFGGDHERELALGLQRALNVLRSHKAFLDQLFADGAKLQFFVGWFSEAMSRDVLHWEILRDMADLHISLDLDVYGPDPVVVADSNK